MIFAAALVDAQMTHEDMMFALSHNPQFRGVMFKGKVELAECTQPAGKMRRFVWRLNDHEVHSTDVTLVIMFNQTLEPRSPVDYQFVLTRRQTEIQECLDWLADQLNPVDVETQFFENGNIAYHLRACEVEKLSSAFAAHTRKRLKEVE